MSDEAGPGGQPDLYDLTRSSPLSRPPEPAWPERPLRERGRRRAAVVALAVALLSALAGGVVGGFVGSRSAGAAYTLGPVPPALTNRPADSVAGIAARVLPGVVMIKVDGSMGTGSGFVISGGFIVTDDHVVTLDGEVQHATLQVVLNGGQTEPAQLVGADPYSDIAVLRLQHPVSLQALPLGNSAGVEVGDPVLAVGSPLGLSGTVTSGIVSAVQRPVQPASDDNPPVFYDAIQTDAPINPGNSGGPLVNAQAEVIGVNAAIDTLGSDPLTGTEGGSIGLGFAIPINQARRVAAELIATGRAAHSVLGADVSSSFGGDGAQIAPGQAGGPPVTPGGPAARAGLRPGDVIVRFAGQPIGSGTALLDAVRSKPPGSRVTITFVRDGASHTVTLTLGSAESLPARAGAGFMAGPPTVYIGVSGPARPTV
jgi:S1-C subfamily serine protease